MPGPVSDIYQGPPDDLVTRLRNKHEYWYHSEAQAICKEAADEIERLEEEVLKNGLYAMAKEKEKALYWRGMSEHWHGQYEAAKAEVARLRGINADAQESNRILRIDRDAGHAEKLRAEAAEAEAARLREALERVIKGAPTEDPEGWDNGPFGGPVSHGNYDDCYFDGSKDKHWELASIARQALKDKSNG